MAGVQIDGVNNKIDFDDDLDTSISANTDDTLVIEAGGNTMATITATTFTINDGTTITTADNTDTLTLISTDADENIGPVLRAKRVSSSAADNDELFNLILTASNDAQEDTDFAKIKYLIKDASNGTEDAQIDMQVMQAGSLRSRMKSDNAETVFNEDSVDIDFRVESNGNANMLFVDGGNDRVGIGTSSPTTALTVNGIITHIGGTASSTSDLTTGGLHFHDSSTADGNIMPITFTPSATANRARAGIGFISQSQDGSAGFAADIAFYTRGAADGSTLGTSDERVRIHSEGVMSASAGVALGVGTANTASNVLDDYEEGTFTMGMADSSGNALTMNGTYAVMHYTKIGNMVHINGLPVVTSIASAGSDVRITGLPFTSKSHATNYSTLAIGYASSLSIPDDTVITSYVNQNSTIAPMRIWTNTTGTDQLSASQLSDGAEFVISGTYIAA
jgi:prepilin-type processing-associated H-X9-DG protein